MIVSPPSSRMPTSNDTRVRVEGRSNTMASILPARGRSPAGTPLTRLALIAAARASTERNSGAGISDRSRKCLGMALLGGAGLGAGCAPAGLDGMARRIDARHGFADLAL